VEAERTFAARHDEADVAVDLAIGAYGLDDGRRERAPVHRQREPERVRRRLETREVGVEAEDPAVVDADPLEDTVAVEQAVVEDGNARLGARNESAVDRDEHQVLRALAPARRRVRGGASTRSEKTSRQRLKFGP